MPVPIPAVCLLLGHCESKATQAVPNAARACVLAIFVPKR
jgi:hypothetical protein